MSASRNLPIPFKGGDEYDYLTQARKVLCSAKRPGVCKAAKRSYWRRVRHEMNAQDRRGLDFAGEREVPDTRDAVKAERA